MQRNEVLNIIDQSWKELSDRRGYEVSKDRPVCIFICQNAEKPEPSLKVHIVRIPETDDFQAFLIGEVDGIETLIDPVHLAWRTEYLENSPTLEEATIFLPIKQNLDLAEYIPNIDLIDDSYLNAIRNIVEEMADK